MKANFSKRFAAYIIDMMIVAIVCNLVIALIPKSSNYNKLLNQSNEIVEKYSEKLTGEDSKMTDKDYKNYLDEIAPISYQIERESFVGSIIAIVIYVLYYVVFQYKNNGQTLGKKLMKIKVTKDSSELTINDLIFRSFIVNSILSGLINLVLLFTTKNINYIYASEVISIIFSAILIVSGLMCCFRKDKKALQDVITKTSVVEVKQ